MTARPNMINGHAVVIAGLNVFDHCLKWLSQHDHVTCCFRSGIDVASVLIYDNQLTGCDGSETRYI